MTVSEEWAEIWTQNEEDAAKALADARFDLERNYFPEISVRQIEFILDKYPNLL